MIRKSKKDKKYEQLEAHIKTLREQLDSASKTVAQWQQRAHQIQLQLDAYRLAQATTAATFTEHLKKETAEYRFYNSEWHDRIKELEKQINKLVLRFADREDGQKTQFTAFNEYFKSQIPNLLKLGAKNKFILIKLERVEGIFSSMNEALDGAHELFPHANCFIVQIYGDGSYKINLVEKE